MGYGLDEEWEYEEDDDEFGNSPAIRKLPKQLKAPSSYDTKGSVQRGAMVDMQCHCGSVYQARAADLERGWGYSCSKRCAAIRRDFGRPKATRAATKEKGE